MLSLNEVESYDLYLKCREIVVEAGNLVEAGKKNEYRVIRKEKRELVTELDLVVQDFLFDSLRKIKKCNIYFEEVREQNVEILLDECFIVDPIDASHNLIAGLPFYNISIGYVNNNKLVFGVIYFPYSNDTYHAYKGKGSYKNTNKISVSKNPSLDKSIVAYDNQFHSCNSVMKNYIKLVNSVFTTRIFGSANMDACFVAEGILDSRVWNATKVYDIVAGSIIVSEAGGLVSDFNNQQLNLKNVKQVVMSNGLIHKGLTKLFNS
jgi:myo-inositol-1(or 4)-monophosphatase